MDEYLKVRRKWRHWRFRNSFMLLASLAIFFLLVRTPFVLEIIHHIGQLGYAGAFFTGIFFTSTFTVAPAAVILFDLAKNLHPGEVALLAGMGAVLGDYVVFRYMKDRVFKELKPLFRKVRFKRARLLFKSPYFIWMLPLVGGLIIASPLPDELGVSMLSVSKIKKWEFFLLSFAMNAGGIFVVVSLSQL